MWMIQKVRSMVFWLLTIPSVQWYFNKGEGVVLDRWKIRVNYFLKPDKLPTVDRAELEELPVLQGLVWLNLRDVKCARAR